MVDMFGNSSRAAVSYNVQGSGTLHVLDKSDRSIIHQHSFTGADTPEAKNMVGVKEVLLLLGPGNLQFDDFQSANHVAYRNKTLFVAAWLGGVKAVNLSRK